MSAPNRLRQVDAQFVWACLAAPLAWAGLAWSGVPLGDPGWPAKAPMQFLTLALLNPLLEELVFRGLLQPGLQKAMERMAWSTPRLAAPVTANVVTSLCFAALHLLSHPPAWAAAAFVPSLIFGYFRHRHGSVNSPIVLHVLYNAGFFVLFGQPR